MSILPSGFHLGPIAFDESGLIGWIIAALVSLYYAGWAIKRRGISGEKVTDVMVGMAAIWVLTPRILSFVYAPSESFAHPILTLVKGAVPYGGWIGLAFALLYALWQQKKHNFFSWAAVDAVARSLVLGFAVFSLFYAKAGAATDLPWAVTIGEGSYHPLNLYQAAIAFGLFALRRRGLFTLSLLGGAMLLLSLLQVHPYTHFGLAVVQWQWLLLAVLAGVVDHFFGENKVKTG